MSSILAVKLIFSMGNLTCEVALFLEMKYLHVLAYCFMLLHVRACLTSC